jgi:pathogenesis-related protein 1
MLRTFHVGMSLVCALALAGCGPTASQTPGGGEPAPGAGGAAPGSELGAQDPYGENPYGEDPFGEEPGDEEPARLGGDAGAYVAEHDRYRAAHCAPPLEWSDELAASAQKWADTLKKRNCPLEHSDAPYGENLAAATPGTLSPADVVEMWYREVDEYDFRKPSFSGATGHFTQVVWADSRRLGCGVSACDHLEIFVCQYDPPGNVMGDFERNVQPTGCR